MTTGPKRSASQLRRTTGTTGSLMLTIPSTVGRHLEHLLGREFDCELTDDGVVFRLLSERTIPAWVKNGQADA